jgi:predicted aldo/keto reductase-like oxidoreductase
MYGRPESARREYNRWLPKEERASECIACFQCESLCPQHIPISEWMPIVHSVLGEGKDYEESMRP